MYEFCERNNCDGCGDRFTIEVCNFSNKIYISDNINVWNSKDFPAEKCKLFEGKLIRLIEAIEEKLNDSL